MKWVTKFSYYIYDYERYTNNNIPGGAKSYNYVQSCTRSKNDCTYLSLVLQIFREQKMHLQKKGHTTLTLRGGGQIKKGHMMKNLVGHNCG